MATLTPEQSLTALQEAQRLYNGARYMDRQSRHDALVSLAEWDLFTTAQLAQISGLSVSTVYGMGLNRGPTAGRFSPQGLDTLVQLRLRYNNSLPVSGMLLKTAYDEGNSLRTISRLTGYSTSMITRTISDYNRSNLQRAAADG